MIRRLSATGQRVAAALTLALVLHLVGTVLIAGYSSEFTVRAMLVLASLLGVASIGQTLVVLLGGIDLSTPFVIGFANVVAAQLYGDGMNFVLVCAIVGVSALAIGAINGALSSTLAVHPLIVTLGVGTSVQGAVLLWTAGFPGRLRTRSGNPICLHRRPRRPPSRPVAHSGFPCPSGADDAGARENALRAAAIRGWQQSASGAVRAYLPARNLDGDLRVERSVRRYGRCAASGVYGVRLR